MCVCFSNLKYHRFFMTVPWPMSAVPYRGLGAWALDLRCGLAYHF